MSNFPNREATAEQAPAPAPVSPPAPGYPAELECDVTTERGMTLRLRPIRPDDADRLVAFHQLLSSSSVYRRYFSVHPTLSSAEVAHLTNVDYVDRMAFIVQDGDQLVGVGRYDRIPNTTTAEVAFVVADEYQHQGIGLLLLDQLAAAAWKVGITGFIAETMVDNRNMMNVFHDSGFPVTTTLEEEVLSVHFPIEPDEAYRAASAQRRARNPVRGG